MSSQITRRDFLRLSLLSLGAMAFRGFPDQLPQFPPEDQIRVPIAFGRVGADYVNIYTGPSFKSERLGRYKKDTICAT